MTMKIASVELENSLSLAAITVYWIWSDALLVTCVHFCVECSVLNYVRANLASCIEICIFHLLRRENRFLGV